jgi:ElaB/YqjD/DUF883 family membrane-anchored ribosome-binding protein
MSKSNYNGIQDERIKNIERDIKKISHHIDVLNNETGELAKDYAFIRANIQAMSDTNKIQEERMCRFESKIDGLVKNLVNGLLIGIVSVIIVQIILKIFA